MLEIDKNIDNQQLVSYAFKGRENSYSPYSSFKVGACLLFKNKLDGKYYISTGCNIENAAFGPSVCAERVAIFNAISTYGRNNIEPIKISVVGGMEDGENLKSYAFPCGTCRQVLSEFCSLEKFKVLVAKGNGDIKEYSLKELLPYSFEL